MPATRPPHADAATLRELALRQERLRDQERRGIARELHDELGQLLNAARLLIGQLQRGRGPPPAEGLDRLDELLAHSAACTRRLSRSLRPPALDLGLVPALEALCEDFRSRSGLDCGLSAPQDLPLPDFVAQTLYRVADAALENVRQRGRARGAKVRLGVAASGLTLSVEDDGDEVAPARPPPSPALEGALARAALIGARVAWDAGREGGRRLRLRLPREALRAEQSEDARQAPSQALRPPPAPAMPEGAP